MVFFLKYVRKQLPAFSNNNELQTSKCNQNAITGKLYPTMKSNSDFLDKSLILQAMKLRIKGFLKEFSFKEYLKDPNALEYRDLLRDPF